MLGISPNKSLSVLRPPLDLPRSACRMSSLLSLTTLAPSPYKGSQPEVEQFARLRLLDRAGSRTV